MVTSNHIHLLVVGDGDRDVIPKSIKLIAGRTGQEYNQRKNREDKWSASIAVGSRGFVEGAKSILGGLVKGRKVKEIEEGYQLREPAVLYSDHFGGKKGNIGPKNAYFWDVKPGDAGRP